MRELIGTVPENLDILINVILSYALILAAVATITMTFLELIKTILKWRLTYHKSRVSAWLSDQVCFEELLIMTVAEIDSADALFDQPTDKMMGQIQAATNVAIDFPEVYPHMYRFLTDVPSSEAAARETGGSGFSNPVPDEPDAAIWKRFISLPSSDDFEAVPERDIQKARRARARIDHFVARKLDAFQTRVEYEWARKNQYIAVSAASIFVFALLYYMETPIIPSFVLAFFGGMMSPFAKDIVSALSGLRTKP